jgi:hypothetical protein
MRTGSPFKDSYESTRNLKSLAAKAESVQRMIREASSHEDRKIKTPTSQPEKIHYQSSRVIINLSPKRRSTGQVNQPQV